MKIFSEIRKSSTMFRQNLLKAIKVAENHLQKPKKSREITIDLDVIRFYIPLCPRAYDRFNYSEFRDKAVEGAAKFIKDEAEQKEIAKKIFLMDKNRNKKFYSRAEFGDIVYGEKLKHLYPGLAVRSLIAGLCFTVQCPFGIPSVLGGAVVSLYYGWVDAAVSDIIGKDECEPYFVKDIKELNGAIFHNANEKWLEKNILNEIRTKKETSEILAKSK